MTRTFLSVAALAAALGVGFGGSVAETISIGARPTVLRWGETTTITGGVGSGQSQPDGYRVAVNSETQSVDGKRATVERLTPTGWKKLQAVGLKAQSGYVQYAERRKLHFKVPEGTTIRAVLPRSQVGACYLAGYSKLIRT